MLFRQLLATVTMLLATPSAIAGSNLQHCFGATGNGCSQLSGTSGQPAYCRPALGSNELECIVSAGSIEHDTCCFQHPQGRGCNASAVASGTYCVDEWEKSQDRLRNGLYWTRSFRPAEENQSGTIDFQRLCAAAGVRVAAGDQHYCCSRLAVPTAETDAEGLQRLRCR